MLEQSGKSMSMPLKAQRSSILFQVLAEVAWMKKQKKEAFFKLPAHLVG
jgi:hypothetical protein